MGETKYIRTWRDREGNRVFFMARNHVFDSMDALREQEGTLDMLDYLPAGLTPGEPLILEVPANGAIPLKHRMVGYGPLRPAVMFDGPALAEARGEATP
ncbi:MAG: hypothetical protein AB7P02_05080 [Alphaproteobacteria bacterium]